MLCRSSQDILLISQETAYTDLRSTNKYSRGGWMGWRPVDITRPGSRNWKDECPGHSFRITNIQLLLCLKLGYKRINSLTFSEFEMEKFVNKKYNIGMGGSKEKLILANITTYNRKILNRFIVN